MRTNRLALILIRVNCLGWNPCGFKIESSSFNCRPLYSYIYITKKEKSSPNSLHKLITALNVFTEKSTLQSRQRISGQLDSQSFVHRLRPRTGPECFSFSSTSDSSPATITRDPTSPWRCLHEQNEKGYMKILSLSSIPFTKMDTVDCLMLLEGR